MKYDNKFDDNILFLGWSVSITCFEPRTNIPSLYSFPSRIVKAMPHLHKSHKDKGKVFFEGTSGGACGYSDVCKGVSYCRGAWRKALSDF